MGNGKWKTNDELPGNTFHDNAIDFLSEGDLMTVSFHRAKFKSKIERYAESHPDDVQIIARNDDGTICAHVPITWLKISPPRQVSDKQREANAERLRQYRYGADSQNV